VHDQVGDGVRRPDIDQVDLEPVQVERHPLIDQRGRWREPDVVEVVVGQGCDEALGARNRDLAVDHRLQHRRGSFAPHAFLHAAMTDDLRPGELLVAPAMIAVVVRVDDAGRRGPENVFVEPLHATSPRQVPEGVDHHGTAAGHQAGVTPAQSAIRLQAGIDIVGELFEFHRWHPPVGLLA
jgi:hypothetical protein